MSNNLPHRKPLHERSDSLTNTRSLAVRLVPATPPQLLSQRDNVYTRTPLPTHPSHILSPGKAGKGRRTDDRTIHSEFQRSDKVPESPAPSGSTYTNHEQCDNPLTGSPISRPKPVSRKRLQIHKDSKTFSLVPQDHPRAVDDRPISPTPSNNKRRSLSLSSFNAYSAKAGRSNSVTSCTSYDPAVPTTSAPATPAPATPTSEIKHSGSPDLSPIDDSPSYQFIGGLRKVAKTPDLKQKGAVENSLPPLPELGTSYSPIATSQVLFAKPSSQSQSTEAATTASEDTNYKVYRSDSPFNSDPDPVSSSSSDINYHLLGDPSPDSSIIHRPQAADSDNENYEILGNSSPLASSISDRPRPKYSHESLVVPPLQPRARKPSEGLGYYKSRSRESLRESIRSGSLTSISTVLSQQEASRAIIGSGSLIQLPILVSKHSGTNSWAKPLFSHPQRPMNEISHQWSSQLSTVPSESEGGTDRGSRTWSDNNERRSSAFLGSQGRHSRHICSISSSLTAEDAASRSRSESFEPPQPTLARSGQHQSSSSVRMIGDQDEYGDGITDMRNLRAYPSRTRLSGFYSVSDNGRASTMRSTNSSRANSLLASSIPIWARLYYGSGERSHLGTGAPGSFTEGSGSRANSFRSDTPNTDHFPSGIYSPRRRPREVAAHDRHLNRGSLEISPVPQGRGDERHTRVPNSRQFRTWSMSSLWSPHLRVDRRAARHSVWDPPSISWSVEGGCFGRRNVQLVMFTVGWVLPFAWMVAAFLPLPRHMMKVMNEQDSSTSNLSRAPNDYTRQFGPMDEARYASAKWWRNLNRWMSLVGFFIIAAVVLLVVLGLKEKW